MARSIADIQQAEILALVQAAAAVGITLDPTQWSDYDYRLLLTFAAATGVGLLEQDFDQFTADLNLLISAAVPQTAAWFQAQMLKFQFSATVPQVLQMVTVTLAPNYSIVVPGYATVDPTKQVIGYCSAGPGALGTTAIKVAAVVDGLPADLDSTYPGALASANSYAKLLEVNGITVNVTSGNSDKCWIQDTVYYQGAYSAIIQSSVVAAKQAFLKNIPFNGAFLLSDLEAAIKAVPGVNDWVPLNIQCRADGAAFGSGANLVVASTEVARKYQTQAGFIQGETTTGQTFNDTTTYVAE